jgi:hypothetical protein
VKVLSGLMIAFSVMMLFPILACQNGDGSACPVGDGAANIWGLTAIVVCITLVIEGIKRLFRPRTIVTSTPAPYKHPATPIVAMPSREAVRQFAAYLKQAKFDHLRMADLFHRMSLEDQASWRSEYEQRMRAAQSLTATVVAQTGVIQAEADLGKALINRAVADKRSGR